MIQQLKEEEKDSGHNPYYDKSKNENQNHNDQLNNLLNDLLDNKDN